MKKISFILIALLFANFFYAQKKRVTISESKIGGLSNSYTKSINLETKDTIHSVFSGFQNEEYKTITDIKYIAFSNNENLQEFIKDLKNVLIEMESKVSISWKREYYKLDLYDFSNELYLQEAPKKGKGYTLLTKNQVSEYIVWLETIDFGKG
jgi:hypothetical protein